MSEFKDIFEKANIIDLKNYLLKMKNPCYESDLLKISFNNIKITDLTPLDLYQHHFVLFNILYNFQNELTKENKYLYIHFMRTYLLEYPEKGKCRYYNNDLSDFCRSDCINNIDYCDFHFSKIGDNYIENISTRYFYLDKSNYYKLDQRTAESFISGSWEILAHYSEYKKSFKILDLSESVDLDTIKRKFKELAKKYHPDINKDPEKIFNKINNAYCFIMNTHSIFQKNKNMLYNKKKPGN